MTYSVRKSWLNAYNLLAAKPLVLLPYIIIAFLEGLTLELFFFMTRPPLLQLAGPVLGKFYGPAALHYPVNLVLLPRIFFSAQMFIYVVAGVALMSISVDIVKRIYAHQPLKIGVLIKNALRRYPLFMLFGLLMMAAVYLLKAGDDFVYLRAQRFLLGFLPRMFFAGLPFIYSLFVFFTNIILQVFLLLTVPLMVVEGKALFPALCSSITRGFCRFGRLFSLIFLPFLLYLPVTLLKGGADKLADKIFPEINVWVLAAGIVFTIFIECFITICAAQFLLEKE